MVYYDGRSSYLSNIETHARLNMVKAPSNLSTHLNASAAFDKYIL